MTNFQSILIPLVQSDPEVVHESLYNQFECDAMLQCAIILPMATSYTHLPLATASLCIQTYSICYCLHRCLLAVLFTQDKHKLQDHENVKSHRSTAHTLQTKPIVVNFFVQLHIQNGGTLKSISTLFFNSAKKREVGFDFLDAHKRSVGQGVASRERCS